MGVLSKGKLIARAAENHEEQRRIMKKVLATAKECEIPVCRQWHSSDNADDALTSTRCMRLILRA
eukprot:scaffold268689_cov41-Tisochrysis_lutea.AAC.1